MPGDLEALLKVSASASALAAYARFAASITPPGLPRLLSLLPSVPPLLLLPLSFSSLHLRAISSFFLAWLASFKLLLLSFASGPLSPSLPLLTFLPLALLPISPSPSPKPKPKPPHLLSTAFKAILLSLIIPLYARRNLFPNHHLLLALYCLHIYLALDLILSLFAFLARILLGPGLGLEPQFAAPYLSTSLRDFWGRRWNLAVTSVLRPSVYGPVRARWGAAAGVLATFLVSGVMHELMFYYITSAAPSGEVACFFVLHGVCTAAEGWLARRRRRRRVNTGVAIGVTMGFVVATGCWLFLPPVMRSGADGRVVEECEEMMRGLVEGGRAVLGWLGVGVERADQARV